MDAHAATDKAGVIFNPKVSPEKLKRSCARARYCWNLSSQAGKVIFLCHKYLWDTSFILFYSLTTIVGNGIPEPSVQKQ